MNTLKLNSKRSNLLQLIKYKFEKGQTKFEPQKA